jgi:crotonobetainyl-CoA:carnitine CoA-transferase CaiB-like acyl-CoA transferase
MLGLHPDLNHGKWNACLDLRNSKDCRRLRELISEADVFLQGYRPGMLNKYGFSQAAIMEMVQNRDRGIIYCSENCYGWQGS